MPPPNQTDPNNGQGGPARSGPAVDPAQANAALDAFNRAIPSLKEIADQAQRIADRMEKVNGTVDGMTKKTKAWGNEMQQTMEYADKIEESMKVLADYQKRMGRDGIKPKSYEEVLRYLKEMEEHHKRLVNEGVFSKQNARRMQEQTSSLRRAIGEVNKELGSTFDDRKVKRWMESWRKGIDESVRLSKTMKAGRMPGLRHDVARAGAAMSGVPDMLGIGAKHRARTRAIAAQFRPHAQNAAEIRKAREVHRAKRSSDYDARHKEIRDSAIAETYRTGKRDPASVDGAIRRAARAQGAGRAEQYFLGRHARESLASERGPGVITRAGVNILARGGGSLGKGVASMGLNALEGGATGLMELAPEVAPLIAGYEAIKGLYNKNQKMNADVASTMGNGGLFANPGSNAIDAIRMARNNLSGPMYSPMGIGYDKNLAIAKSLQEGGFSTANLGKGPISRDGQGFMQNSFGALQKNVYAYGRIAGMDSSQTVAETIKLVGQYKMSLESTHDFYSQVTKDAATAGMTTSKYIQIQDSVLDHYERSNKLLEATVDTMRLLSVTGRNTAEDLKDAMDTVTNGGQKKGLEVSAFLNQNMLGDRDLSGRMGGALQLNMQDALENVAKALGGKANAGDLGDMIKKQGPDAFNALLQRAREHFGDDKLGYQQASGAIEKARTAYRNQANFGYAQSEGPNRGGIDLAASRALTGDDINSQSLQNLSGLKWALKNSGFTTADFMDKSRAPAMDSSLTLQKSLEAVQMDPTKMAKINSLLFDSASARMDIAGQGLQGQSSNSERGRFLEETYQYLSKQGVKFDPHKNHADALQDMAGSKDGRERMITLFSKWDKTLEDIYNSPTMRQQMRPKLEAADRDARMSQAEDLASSTRTTADLYADAFSSFFNHLQTPLDFIARILGSVMSHMPGYTNDAASSGQLDGINQRYANGKMDIALKGYDRKIEELQDRIKNPGAGDSVSKLTDDLTDARNNREAVRRVRDAQSDTEQFHHLSGSVVQRGLDAIDKGPLGSAPRLSEFDTQQLLTDLHAPGLKKGQTVAVPDGMFSSMEGKFDSLPAGLTLNQTKDAKGGTHYTITNNNYSLGITQEQNAANDLRNAGETAMQPKVTK